MMKKNIVHAILLISLSSCMKDEIPAADLSVSTTEVTYHAGDPVTFRFSGEPDNIVFYSGEDGSNYELRNRVYADNELAIDFKTLVQWGEIYQNLQLLVSNDFNGIYDKDNVNLATWVDISDKAIFSSGEDNTPSGSINLKSYASPNDTASLYIAFRYTDAKKPQQNRWVIRTFNASKISPEGTVTNVATMSTAGWKGISFLNDSRIWTISSAQLLMHGGVATDAANDDWVITKGFKVRESVPDKGIALKNLSTTINEYKYTYQQPGTYKAVFETSSIWYSGSKRSTKELIVNIEP